jgi:hypothetical protein
MSARDAWLWQLLPSLSGLPSHERYRRSLLVIQTYVDDSGSGGPPVFLLAGFIARAEAWAELSEKWSAVIRSGPRKLEYFKMQEANALEEQFSRWSSPERDAIVLRLTEIIRRHVIIGVSSVVYISDYNTILKDKLSKEMDNPYWLMYHCIMRLALQWEFRAGIKEERLF